MMTRRTLAATAILPCEIAIAVGMAIIASMSTQAAEPDIEERSEPSLIVRVDIGDESASLALGQESKIKVDGRELKLRLTPSPKRTLRLSGLSFDYPRHLAFEYDNEAHPLEIWSLDGNDVVIMVQRYPLVLGDLTEAIVEQFAEKFGVNNVEQSKVTVRLADKTRQGTLLKIDIVDDVTLTQTIYGWLGKRHGFVLLLQDTLMDDGKHSKEYEDTLQILTKSFTEKPTNLQKTSDSN